MKTIGIAGGSGSGKSTLTERLKSLFPDATVLYHDNYYRHHPELTAEERSRLNFDHPDALETELLVEHLEQLKCGKAVQCPLYDFSTHLRREERMTVEPSGVVIVEGILLFHWRELREILDWKIYVDVPADIRLLRRFLRDTKERGRSPESIAEQYMATVRPMHEQFVEPTKCFADRIVRDCLDPAEWESIKVEARIRAQ